MANNAETRVTFKVFNQEFNKGISEMNSASSKLRQEFALQEEQMKQNASESEKLRAKIEYLEKAQEMAAQKVAATEAQLQRAKEVFGENSQEVDRLERQLTSARIAEQRLGNQLAETNDELSEQTDRAQKAADALSETGDKMTAAGESMMGLSAGVAAVGAAGILAASDVETAMGKIQAQTGATAELTEELTTQAENLWKNGFGENVNDAADAIVTVKNNILDMPVDKIEEAAEKAYILQDAFGIELAESTSLVDNLMAQYGVTSDEAFDSLTTGFQNGLNYGDDFADTLREYGPIFAGMGMDLEDSLSFLQTAKAAGFRNLDVAADTFKEFSLLAQEGGEDFVGALSAMGKETENLYAGFKEGKVSGEDLFFGIAGALDNIQDPQARFNAGVATMGTLFEDNTEMNIKNMAYMRDELATVEGATSKAGEALYDNFGARMQGVWRQFLDSMKPVGEILLNLADTWLPKISAAISGVTQWFANLSPVGQTVVMVIGAIAAAIGPLLIFIGNIVGAISTLIPAVVAVWGWLAKLGPVFTVIRTTLTALTGPIGIAIAIITALAIIIYKNWDTIKAKTIEIWGAIKEWFTQTWTSIKEGLTAAWGAITLWLSETWNNIKLIAVTVWTALKDGVMAIITPFITGITNIFNGMKEGLTNILEGLKLYFTGVWEMIKNIFLGAILLIVDLVTGDFEGLKNDAMAIFNNLKAAFSQIWAGIQLIFTGVIQAIVGYVTAAWNNLKSTCIAIFNAITSGISTAWTNAKNFTVNLVQSLISGAIEKFQALKDGISNKMSEIPNKIREIWNSAKSFLSSINLSQIGRDIISGLLNGITSMASSLYNKAKEIADGIKNKIKNALNINSPSRVMMELGQFTGEGLAIGIENMKKTVSKAADLLAQHAVPEIQAGKPSQTGEHQTLGDRLVSSVANNQPIHVTVVSTLDGYEVARNQYSYINEMLGSDSQLRTALNGG
jgi:TP901 family phage tail tape measure protein